jgi:hypothetical protein
MSDVYTLIANLDEVNVVLLLPSGGWRRNHRLSRLLINLVILGIYPEQIAANRCGQSSWLQIQRSEFDSRHYQIFWEFVGLERGPLSLMSTIEELLERKISGSGLESREYGVGIHHAHHATPLYP